LLFVRLVRLHRQPVLCAPRCSRLHRHPRPRSVCSTLSHFPSREFNSQENIVGTHAAKVLFPHTLGQRFSTSTLRIRKMSPGRAITDGDRRTAGHHTSPRPASPTSTCAHEKGGGRASRTPAPPMATTLDPRRTPHNSTENHADREPVVLGDALAEVLTVLAEVDPDLLDRSTPQA